MTDSLLRSVVHPTDFSPAGLDAFTHALRLAVAAKSHFYILHIERETEQAHLAHSRHSGALGEYRLSTHC
jgi:hypothetical protein